MLARAFGVSAFAPAALVGAMVACTSTPSAAAAEASGRAAPAGSQTDQGTATTPDGARIAYESEGAGPTVVLIHGGNLDRRMWDEQVGPLAARYRVVRYDARGYGRSSPAIAPYAAHDDLLAVLRAARVRRAALVGLSLGGRIAVDFALEHPDMVDALVLAGPGLSGFRWSPSADTAWTVDLRAALGRRDSVAAALTWLQSAYMRPAMDQPALAARLRELSASNATFWMHLSRSGDKERPLTPPAVTRLASLRAPTLLAVGTRETPDIRRIVDTLAAAVPGARRVVFDGAGHMLSMEQPARFTAEVLAFLAAVPGYAPRTAGASTKPAVTPRR